MDKKILIVGGNWDPTGGRKSSIVEKLEEMLGAKAANGGFLSQLSYISEHVVKEFDVTIWMPNVENYEEKYYPKKRVGSILICSKVMRPGYNRFDSVTRIFKTHGNAVIEIHPDDNSGYRFSLVDALNNEWVDTRVLEVLCRSISEFVTWNSGVERIGCKKMGGDVPDRPEELKQLCEVTKLLADKVESERGGRFFGNASTRCMKMFPNMRDLGGAWVSARNIDKHRIEPEDFVYSQFDFDKKKILYHGDRKPSVDTPVQLEVFKNYPKINYMLHGHAFIKDAPYTDEYFPCGDMREVKPLFRMLNCYKFLNLKNHGFLIVARTIRDLEDEVMALIKHDRFINKVPPALGV